MLKLLQKGLRTSVFYPLHRRPAYSIYISRLLLFALLLFLGKARAQEVGLPAVIKPSPQSMAFTRYGDYPMTGNNGLTDITIPVHTITGRKLSLPITMSFHASGMMAGEVEGVLGMRWTLNCGGLVTRTMKGSPDEWNYLDSLDINNYIESSQPINFDLLYSSCTDGKIHNLSSTNIEGTNWVKWYDSEYDIFNYSLPNGKSGHFILKGAPGSKVAMTIPYDPIKIEFAKAPTENGYFESFTITDVDGTKYRFGKIDAATDNAVESNVEWDIVDNRLGDVSTAWYLTKIIASDNTDEISLFYNTKTMEYWAPTQTATIRDRLRDYDPGEWASPGSEDPYLLNLKEDLIMWHFDQSDVLNEVKNKNNVPYLSSIQFNGGSASLNYTTPSFYSAILSNIIINRGAVPYKKVTFNLFTQTGGSMHFLNNVSFYGEDQTTLAEKYDFSYYDATTLSPQDLAPIKDWWGYLTSFGGQGLILPQTVAAVAAPMDIGHTQNLGSSNVKRDADESAKIGGMLKTITYPTGGQTEFIYENNKYDWQPYYQGGVDAHTLDGPGLRIKEVVSTPLKGRVVHKEYKYGIYEDGRGYINDFLRPGSAAFADLKIMESNTMHYWTWVQPGGSLGGVDQVGYRDRQFLGDPYISFDLSANNIKYDAVTEYVYETDEKDNLVPRQKTQTRYSWGDNAEVTTFNVTDQAESITDYRKFSNPEHAWLNPVMTGKTFYKYENGQYAPIKTETYTYSSDEKDHAWDLPTYLHTNIVYAIVGTGLSGYSGPLDNYLIAKSYHNEWPASVYGWGYRKYATGSQKLTNTTIEEYTSAGTILTQKTMDYDDDNLIRHEVITNSKNEQLTTTYSYPKNFNTVSPYDAMVSLHIISPVIEQVSTNNTLNDKELARTKINYSFFQDNTLIQPSTIQRSVLGNTLETEATFDAYDSKGNILQVTGKDGVITSYIWGYDQTYPIAKVVGRTYADATASQIGLDLNVLNNVSSSDATMRTELNKLRALQNCLVSTYTYKPLTGMTSETDPDGRTIYYEYDVAGRLALMRDKDNNILKKYAYDYQGQCTSCGAMTTANWQATGNTRGIPCEADINFSGPNRQREEKDINPASSTFNQTRWVEYPSFNEALYTKGPYWVNTSTPPRCIQMSGQNTGEQEQEQIYHDPNPCHMGQNDIRWLNTGMNTNACPLPAAFTNSKIDQDFYSSVCVSPAQPDPIPVFVPAGMFTSTLTIQDAEDKAWQYAQTYADQHGTCTIPPVTLNFINNHGYGFNVSLYDAITGQPYELHSAGGANASLSNLPQGTYYIYIEPSFDDDWIWYKIGCGDAFESQGVVATDEIEINADCNTITVN